MKKLKLILFNTLLLIVLLPTCVKADWPDCHMQIEDDYNVSMGDTFVVSLGSDGTYSNSNYYINGLHFVIEYYKDELEPVLPSDGGISSIYGWENISAYIHDTDSRVSYLIIDANTRNLNRYVGKGQLGTGYNKLLNVTFKVKNDIGSWSTGTFIRLMPTELDGSGRYYPTSELMSYKTIIYDGEYEYETCVASPQVAINFYKKAYLNNITVNKNNIKNFNKNQYLYNLTYTDETIEIGANTDAGYTITGDIGKKALKYGNNVFNISVTSPTGDVKKYTLNINRPDNRSDVNSLESLTISNLEFNFQPEKYEYELEVNYEIDKIIFNSKLTDAKSSYIEGFGNREEKLDVGKNEFLIKIKSEKGTEKTYTINILRKEDTHTCDISELKIDNYSIDFKNNITNYSLNIDYNVNNLNINVSLANPESKYTIIGNENLTNGSIIVIKVTDTNNNSKEFNINIIKDMSIPEKETNEKIIIIFSTLLGATVVLMTSIIIITNKKNKKQLHS